MADAYQLHVVDNLSQLVPFGEWLSDRARMVEPIALAIRERQKKFCLSSRDDAWVLDMKTQVAPLAAGVFRTQIIEHVQLKLLCRNTFWDLRDTAKFLAPYLGITPRALYYTLAPAVTGDLTAAAQCINQTVTPRNKFTRIEHDAFEVALLEPQYAMDISEYYQKVALPMGKLTAETAVAGTAGKTEWFVTYQDLWLRVLAYYTGDPTLGWAFEENRDPLEAIANLLKLSPEQAGLLLRWQTCGRDLSCFNRRYPGLVRDLPDDLEVWAALVDRSLPALSLNCKAMIQSYSDTRHVETRFRRRLRPGNPMGEAVAFRVFGTTEEIVSVAAATFWLNRTSHDTMITGIEGGPDAPVIRINGVGPKDGLNVWCDTLRKWATLANPLGQLHLNPAVTLLG